jgi:hypothetical protein
MKASIRQLEAGEQTLRTVVCTRVLPKGSRKVNRPLKEDIFTDGIIGYLAGKHGGNVHDRGFVSVTAKTISDDPEGGVKNAVEFNGGFSGLWSKNQPGQWVCLDFQEMRVRPTNYVIRDAKLKSWVVEGSADGVAWQLIDKQTDSMALQQEVDRIGVFAVSVNEEFRFVRLTQVANHGNYDGLSFFAIELFGLLLE